MSLPSLVAAINAALQADDLARALPLLQQALRLAPEHAGIRRTAVSVYANASARALRAQQVKEAERLAQAALALDAKHQHARLNLAASLSAQQQHARAAQIYRALDHEFPNDGEIASYLKAADMQAAEIELEQNATAAAHSRLKPYAASDTRACLRRLALPFVYRDQQHLWQARLDYSDIVSQLTMAPKAKSLEDLLHVNFRLAYQGLDDTALQGAYGDWLAQQSAAFQPTVAKPHKARIGLVSSFFRECTVGAYFGAWVKALSRAGFDVELYQLQGPGQPDSDQWTAQLFQQAQHAEQLSGNLQQCAEHLAARGLDLLLYPELGMDARTFVLASLRLARLQIAAWGHPVTSGLPSIDYFFSCAEMEPIDANAHYRERLLLLPGIGVRYQAPALPAALDAADLGLPTGVPLVLMPQSAFKLMPENDARMVAIAQAVPDAHFVLFQAQHQAVTQALQQRLAQQLQSAHCDPNKLIFLPMGSRDRFLQVNSCCHLMLDSTGFSGGNTSIDALLCGLPIWTNPGRFMRARQSSAMLKILGRLEPDFSEHMARLREQLPAQAMQPDQQQLLLDDANCERALVAQLMTLGNL